jgi:hypothetical protein
MDEDYNIAKGHGGEPQMRKTRERSWTAARHRNAFLEYLAESGNVTLATKKAGLNKSNGYKMRRRDEAFREQWREALAQGRDGMMDMLHERASEGLAIELDGTGQVPAMYEFSTKLALTLIKMHKATAEGENDGYGRGPRPPRTADELRASILEKLDAMHRRLHGEAAEAEAGGAGAGYGGEGGGGEGGECEDGESEDGDGEGSGDGEGGGDA